MKPDALLHLIEDFESFVGTGNDLYDRLAAFSHAVKRTKPDGTAEDVLLKHLQSLLDGAKGRLGRAGEHSVASGGAAGALQMALADLRKSPEFVTAFAHIRRSKNMREDLGDDDAANGADAYAAPTPKVLVSGNGVTQA